MLTPGFLQTLHSDCYGEYEGNKRKGFALLILKNCMYEMLGQQFLLFVISKL